MVPKAAAEVSEMPMATSECRVTERTDALCTGSSDAYAENWPTASNGSLELVAYIYASPPTILNLLELLEVIHTPKNTSKPYKSSLIISLGFSTSFVKCEC